MAEQIRSIRERRTVEISALRWDDFGFVPVTSDGKFIGREPGTDAKQEAGPEFLGYDEPIGTRIALSPNDTARVRLANHFFHGEMFRYFENLASGQTGWGISFNNWLEIHGWELIGYMTYERVQGMEDDSC